MSADRKFHSGVARRMRNEALFRDDKFTYMVGLLLERLNDQANETHLNADVISAAQSVARTWLEDPEIQRRAVR